MPEQPLSHIPFRKGLYPFSPHSPFPTKGESTPDKHPPDTLPPVRTAPAKPHEIPPSHRTHLSGTDIHPPRRGRHGKRITQETADAGRRPVPRPPALATWGLIRNGATRWGDPVLPRSPRPAGQKAGVRLREGHQSSPHRTTKAAFCPPNPKFSNTPTGPGNGRVATAKSNSPEQGARRFRMGGNRPDRHAASIKASSIPPQAAEPCPLPD